MDKKCIQCKRILTSDNSYTSSWSCNDCVKKSQKRYRCKHPYLSREKIREIRDSKPCIVCGGKEATVFILPKPINTYTVNELKEMLVIHGDCLFRMNYCIYDKSLKEKGAASSDS